MKARKSYLRSILLLTGLLLVGMCSMARAQSEAAPPPPPPPGAMMMHGPGPMDFMGHDEMGGKIVKGVPVTADLSITRDTTLADGNRIHTENQTKIYRDSEGRMRREVGFELNTPTTGAAKRSMVIITDPVAGKRYILNPQTKTAREMPLRPKGESGTSPPDGEADGLHHDHDATFTREQLGAKSINGLQAEGTRVTHTIPAGKIGNEKPIDVVTERWVSTDLQLPLTTTHSDPMMGTVTTKLTNINRGEPDASLFQIPADYKIETGRHNEPMYMPMKP